MTGSAIVRRVLWAAFTPARRNRSQRATPFPDAREVSPASWKGSV